MNFVEIDFADAEPLIAAVAANPDQEVELVDPISGRFFSYQVAVSGWDIRVFDYVLNCDIRISHSSNFHIVWLTCRKTETAAGAA